MVSETLDEADGALNRRDRRSSELAFAASALVAIGVGATIFMNHEDRSWPTPARGGELTVQTSGDRSGFVTLHAGEALKTRLSERGLSGLDVISSRASDVIVVEGELRQSQVGTWSEVREWFDASFGADVQLDTHLAAEQERFVLPFSVESIWMTPTPRLTLHDGSQSRVGDTLPGGWNLDAIDQEEVKISKDGKRLVLSL